MCTPKASEISSQMSFVQFSCWTNVTYNGIFTPPPLLEVRQIFPRFPQPPAHRQHQGMPFLGGGGCLCLLCVSGGARR